MFGLSIKKRGMRINFIGDMEISKLIIYVYQVEEVNLRDRKEFKNKKAKTWNESR